MSDKLKSILFRFLKGFVSGAVTAMLMVTVAKPDTWAELVNVINILSIAGIFGGINGALLALQKWYTWVD